MSDTKDTKKEEKKAPTAPQTKPVKTPRRPKKGEAVLEFGKPVDGFKDSDSKTVEQWAEEAPVKRLNARLIRIEGKWGAGKTITFAQYKSVAKAILETPIGFKN
jgi:hypothetical protein